VVPLSEHEQRLLDQIERALYAEDPKFASTVRSTDLRTHMKRRMRRAGALLLIGFVMMLFGIAQLAIGIFGFVMMLLGLAMALSAYKRLGGGGSSSTLRVVDGGAERKTGTGRKRTKKSGTTRSRLEERWQKRWEERGGLQ
jgi:hypothetical protein